MVSKKIKEIRKEILKQAIRIVGMVMVGISISLMKSSFILFMVIWILGWFVYDLNTKVDYFVQKVK